MRETLYIRLGSALDADVDYAVVASEPRALSQQVAQQHGPLAAAAALAPGRRVCVFVPAADVRLSKVQVPAKQPAKVLQAVPYALEDQVAEDIDLLHFAIGPRQADGQFPVAIVSRARMQRWTEALSAHGLRPEYLVPESLALDVDDNGAYWHALVEDTQVIVRQNTWSYFTCLAEDLASYLSLVNPDQSQSLQLHLAGDQRTDWSCLGWPLNLLPHANALTILSAHYRADRAINLLQGSYAQGRDVQRLWKPWQLAAALLLAWLVAGGSAYTLDTLRLSTELQRQDQANLARFQQLFPDQTRVVDLQAQLDQQLRQLGGGAAGGPFPLLESLAQALAASPGLKLGGMQYRENALFLSLTANDLQALEALRNWFASHAGTRLEVQSANAESGAVQIRAKLTAA
ncbi:MAG: type II secretion system protein GspL [Panacagrimonas sp.]